MNPGLFSSPTAAAFGFQRFTTWISNAVAATMPPPKEKNISQETYLRATSVWEELGRIIQGIIEDSASPSVSIPLEELLILHDELGEVVRSVEEKGLVKAKPALELKGLETLWGSYQGSESNGTDSPSIIASSEESKGLREKIAPLRQGSTRVKGVLVPNRR